MFFVSWRLCGPAFYAVLHGNFILPAFIRTFVVKNKKELITTNVRIKIFVHFRAFESLWFNIVFLLRRYFNQILNIVPAHSGNPRSLHPQYIVWLHPVSGRTY